VTVDSVGLASLQPIAPLSAAATVTGADQATIVWTPASGDRADGYKVYLEDGTPVRSAPASDPDSLVIDGLDLGQPVRLWVVATNAFGESAGVAAPPIGGGGTPPGIEITSAAAGPADSWSCSPQGRAAAESSGSIWMTASGRATAAAAVSSVDYRLHGVLFDGERTLLTDWTPAIPCDGAFDSGDEVFGVFEDRPDEGYYWFDLDARASASGLSAVASTRVFIMRDTVPPHSAVDPLPSSTRNPAVSLTGYASDDPPGSSATITIDVSYRFRATSNGAWGPWTQSGVSMSGSSPYSFSQPFAFPNGNGYYEFRSIARDQFGNQEAAPASADATIRMR
jgi:hypothetical protein